MSHTSNIILEVAVDRPLRKRLEYLAPTSWNTAKIDIGMRLLVPFRNRNCVALLLAIKQESDYDITKLKQAKQLLDYEALLPDNLFQLGEWACQYYQYPIGEVLIGTLPKPLRHGKPAVIKRESSYICSKHCDDQLSSRAHQQRALYDYIKTINQPLSQTDITTAGFKVSHLKLLLDKGLITQQTSQAIDPYQSFSPQPGLSLNSEQKNAVDAINSQLDQFNTFLLEGITGSGKTEIYLQVIEKIIAKGQQALVLVPEIGLTPQTIERFQARFNVPIATLHSGLSDNARMQTWLKAKQGEIPIIIGTRSAVFLPMANLGMIIIDEEHDTSFKQQEGFRYSARDLAVVRAKQLKIPLLLGTATPCLQSLQQALCERYQLLRLTQRAANAKPPNFQILDIRNQPLEGGISPGLQQAIHACLAADQQVLLFINRRGYAPSLLCHHCGWTANCHNCDARYTLHVKPRHLHCHYCDHSQSVMTQCPNCQSHDLNPVGMGTERIEESCQQLFPNNPVIRIDRDSTRRKGALHSILQSVQQGKGQILLGTQMLAKGHHFPNVTLVAILNADSGLYSADFRANERFAQLFMQVAGRAGRAELPGRVLLQTHNPDHPLLNTLIHEGYHAFAIATLAERKTACLPPFSYLALLKAEARSSLTAQNFLHQIKKQVGDLNKKEVFLLGPIPAPMEKKAGVFRAHLLIQAASRKARLAITTEILNFTDKQKRVDGLRWVLDVDPIEIF